MTTTTAAPIGALMTRREVAALLKLSDMSVCRLVERGFLACYRIGRRMRFELADIKAFLASRRHERGRPSSHGGA